MILQLREALAKRGLSLHPSKCQVQTNVENWTLRGKLELDKEFFGSQLTVLGTSLALFDVTACEVRHRAASGWRLFWAMKPLLLKHNSSLKQRLHLFDSTVGSCVLWCAQSWTLRVQEVHKLRTVQRSMLRKILAARRAPKDWEGGGGQRLAVSQCGSSGRG